MKLGVVADAAVEEKPEPNPIGAGLGCTEVPALANGLLVPTTDVAGGTGEGAKGAVAVEAGVVVPNENVEGAGCAIEVVEGAPKLNVGFASDDAGAEFAVTLVEGAKVFVAPKLKVGAGVDAVLGKEVCAGEGSDTELDWGVA